MKYPGTDLLVDQTVKAMWYPERFGVTPLNESSPVLIDRARKIDHGPIRGMHFLSFEEHTAEHTTVKIQSDQPGCFMCFVLSGEITSVFMDGALQPFRFISGQHNLIYTPGFEILLDIQQPFSVLFTYVSEAFIEDLISGDFPNLCKMSVGIASKQACSPGPNMPITPAMGSVIHSLIETGTTGGMKQLFFQSKIMELLNLQLEQFDQAQQQDFSTSLKSYDITKIYYARKLVEENIRQPCSLIELAHKAGLNDFKLKKGFKEIVGNTVFGYLFELRMEKARQLLLARKTVSEVAWQTGYKNPHHFTAAFKKKYGFLPSQLNK